MRKEREGEDLIPEVAPARNLPPKDGNDLLPDREQEYRENSNEKYRDRTEEEDEE